MHLNFSTLDPCKWCIVVDDFWCMLRSRHVFYRPKAPKAANHLSVNGLSIPASPTWAQRGSLGSCLSPHHFDAIYPDHKLNGSHAVIWRFQSSMQGLTPEPLRSLTLKPFEACRSCAGYSWTAQFPRFVNSVMLPDHPHVQNVIMPLHQYMLLWIVTDFSTWLSNNQASRYGRLWKKSQCANRAAAEIRKAQACINDWDMY